jgi:hypothetical protein
MCLKIGFNKFFRWRSTTLQIFVGLCLEGESMLFNVF